MRQLPAKYFYCFYEPGKTAAKGANHRSSLSFATTNADIGSTLPFDRYGRRRTPVRICILNLSPNNQTPINDEDSRFSRIVLLLIAIQSSLATESKASASNGQDRIA